MALRRRRTCAGHRRVELPVRPTRSVCYAVARIELIFSCLACRCRIVVPRAFLLLPGHLPSELSCARGVWWTTVVGNINSESFMNNDQPRMEQSPPSVGFGPQRPAFGMSRDRGRRLEI